MPLKGVSVLIVEDHAVHRELARALLTHLGARVDVAEDGKQGLEKIRQGCPDLVLCDLVMPNMEGYEVARRVRRISECAHVRLVALTALRDDPAYVRSWSAGFDAHLEKPITLAKLNEIAERFLLGRPPPRPRRRRRG
jgi:two-component system, chemotaxis family, CheB/CheR fusion protein